MLLLILALPTVRWQERNYIVYYLCGQFFFNGYANWLNELEKDNLFAYSLNFSWAYYSLSLYFARLYASRKWEWFILGLVALYQLNLIYTLQASSTVADFNSVSFGVVSLLITIACLFYYRQRLAEQPKENILTVSDFWYVNGIFTYYTSNFFIFLTYNSLVSRNYANIGIIWKIHNVVFLVMCVYFFIGMRCKPLPEK
ncbi:hypothetical protein [Spirosoma radiotolerans]|uniref:hypothetical protein n=1 Tax=Spirosoma radiotolerans TaxID=1379870 RepID=UPI0011DCCF84|nr:hypothetical protein [Spirosoma radiotolerans]